MTEKRMGATPLGLAKKALQLLKHPTLMHELGDDADDVFSELDEIKRHVAVLERANERSEYRDISEILDEIHRDLMGEEMVVSLCKKGGDYEVALKHLERIIIRCVELRYLCLHGSDDADRESLRPLFRRLQLSKCYRAEEVDVADDGGSGEVEMLDPVYAAGRIGLFVKRDGLRDAHEYTVGFTGAFAVHGDSIDDCCDEIGHWLRDSVKHRAHLGLVKFKGDIGSEGVEG